MIDSDPRIQARFEIAFNSGSAGPYPADSRMIVNVARERLGLILNDYQARYIWECHSSTLCAGWLSIRDPEEIVDAINTFIADRT